MTRMIRGSVLLAACVGLWSCSSDPLSDEAGVAFKIVALPSALTMRQDSTQLIGAQLVDALDGQIPTTWTITNNSPLLFSVAIDSGFRPVFNPDGSLTIPSEQTEMRATLTGLTLGIGNLTISAGGKELIVPVNVIPGTLHATFAPANPAPGVAVTMTLPPNMFLAPTSKVTFAGNQNPIIVSRAPDGSSITFIPAPTTNAVASVTKVTNTVFPTIPFDSMTTEGLLTTTTSGLSINTLPATFSTLTPGAAPVVMTANAGFGFLSAWPVGRVPPPDTLPVTFTMTFPLQTNPIVGAISVDSSTVSFQVGPNVNQKANVTGVFFRGAPQFVYAMTASQYIVSAAITSVPVTLSSYLPQIVTPVVITAGAGFTFSATSNVTWPAGAAKVLSRTATTLTVQPVPTSAGVPTITGVISASAPAFPITLVSTLPTPFAMLATTGPSPFAGTSDPATAPLVTKIGFLENAAALVTTPCVATSPGGGSGCLYYKINVAAAGPVPFVLSYPATTLGSDLGLYFMDATFNAFTAVACDSHGRGATASPEACTVIFPAAGTYYIELVDYGAFYPGGSATNPPPPWVRVDF